VTRSWTIIVLRPRAKLPWKPPLRMHGARANEPFLKGDVWNGGLWFWNDPFDWVGNVADAAERALVFLRLAAKRYGVRAWCAR